MKKIALAISMLLLNSCNKALHSKQDLPKIELPTSWTKEKTNTVIKEHHGWWKYFQNQGLNQLIDKALKANSDILLVMNNISLAQAMLGIDESYKLPEIKLQAGTNQTKGSKKEIYTLTTKPVKDFKIAGILSYEVDLWDKVANSNKVARAHLLAQESTKDAIELTIISEVAKAYFNLITLKQKISLSEKLINCHQEIIKLQNNLLRNGQVDLEEIQKRNFELIALEKELLILQQQLTEQTNAVIVLVGYDPVAFTNDPIITEALNDLPLLPIILNDIPTKLLEQRPDIRAAEQELIAAEARIEVARTAFFPSISLTGLIGLASNKFNDLSKGNNLQGGISLEESIFNYGRTSSNVKISKAKQHKAYIQYQQIVKEAFKETFNALSAQQTDKELLTKMQKNERGLQIIKDMYAHRYKVGYIDKIHLLISEENLIRSKIQTITAYNFHLNSMVNLFKALGGNWR